jgi:hypothetical protein
MISKSTLDIGGCQEMLTCWREGGFHVKAFWNIKMPRRDAIRATIARFPLFGPLVNCEIHHFGLAFKETAPNVMFSLAPLLIAWLMSVLFHLPSELNNPLYIFRNGELLMAALSAVAPLFFIVTTTFPNEASSVGRLIPSSLLFQFFLIAIVIVSASMFPLFQFANIIDGNLPFEPILNNVLVFSASIYFFSVLIVFVAMSYRAMLQGQSAEPFRRDDSETREGWAGEDKSWRS